MFLNLTPEPMCVVKRRKLVGPGDHYGLALPDASVVDLNQDGVRVQSAEDFAHGQDVHIVRVVDPSKYPVVSQRLAEVRTSPPAYKLLGMNCEDFANWLSGEDAISGQVVAAGIAAVIVAALAAG